MGQDPNSQLAPSAPSGRGRRLRAAGLTGAAVGLIAAVLALARPDALERAELWTYDVRVRLAAEREAPSPRIVMVEVSEADLRAVDENMGLSWPWPRALFGYLVQFITQGGAEAVVLDWIFEDRGQGPASDADEFAAALEQSGRTVFGVTMPRQAPRGPAARRGAWARRMALFPDRERALATAFELQGWGARTFLIAEPSGLGLHVGGRTSAAEVDRLVERLSGVEAFADLVEQQAEPSAPRELTAAELGSEVNVEDLLAERSALVLAPGPGLTLSRRELVPPLARLGAAVARVGNVLQDNDSDGIMRRHQPLVEHEGKLWPSLPLAALLAADPALAVRLEGRDLVVGGKRVALDERGQASLRFTRRDYPRYGAYRLLRSLAMMEEGRPPEIDPSVFAGKYVFVSAAAYGLRDIRVSPVSRHHPGAELNANALDDLLSGRSVRRASAWAEAVLALALALCLALAVAAVWSPSRGPWSGLAAVAAVATAGLVGLWAVAVWLLAERGFWVALAVPGGGALAAIFGAVLAGGALERRDRRFVQEALGRYTSPVLVRELLAHPERLSLEWGEEREISVYFSDIAGFTDFSERLAPARLVALLNDYLTCMTDIVLAHGGVVDKYIGDAVMAFWGAPLPDPDHARKAALAALAMRGKCEEMRPRWRLQYGVEVVARAAVNSGRAVSGNMGSRHKFNYTVMGDMVNLASRLEGANKGYGTTLMISEDCLAGASGAVEVRELDLVAVKGKQRPVRVFEVLCEKGALAPERAEAIARFEVGLGLYRGRRFDEAVAAFQDALRLSASDGPSKTYLERCRRFLEAGPGADWDGVWRMKEK